MLWPIHQKHTNLINENSVTEIHPEKTADAKSGLEAAIGGISPSRHLVLPLPLFPHFLLSLLPASSSVGLPGILMINA